MRSQITKDEILVTLFQERSIARAKIMAIQRNIDELDREIIKLRFQCEAAMKDEAQIEGVFQFLAMREAEQLIRVKPSAADQAHRSRRLAEMLAHFTPRPAEPEDAKPATPQPEAAVRVDRVVSDAGRVGMRDEDNPWDLGGR